MMYLPAKAMAMRTGKKGWFRGMGRRSGLAWRIIQEQEGEKSRL